MTTLEYVQGLKQAVSRESSPFRPGLLMLLQEVEHAVHQHLRWACTAERCESAVVPPRETALGHKPKGITVVGHSVQTDAALEALSCSD